jgi:hypothetical protein
VFLGYSSLHKGYKCLHVPTNRVYISRDVVFDEGVFPFSQLPTTISEPTPHSIPHSGQFDDAAHTPLLLPNHGAGIGRGARLELLSQLILRSTSIRMATPRRASLAMLDRVRRVLWARTRPLLQRLLVWRPLPWRPRPVPRLWPWNPPRPSRGPFNLVAWIFRRPRRRLLLLLHQLSPCGW